ncbi:hypothetical protein GCM10022237_49820 [Nocardioides ginsengisoli]|uniref:Secreted protein n=1 Tax=Nocardioides ginsengisoli TaxID=363868 RepID=A0ABW3W373_9ACTN
MTSLFRAVAAAVLATPLLGAGCSVLDSTDDLSGKAVRAAADAPPRSSAAAHDGWTAEFQLPDGRLTARIAPLTDTKVRADQTFARQAVEAGDGTTLVAVSWASEAGAGVPPVAQTMVLDPRVEDELALVDGDQRVPLEVDGLSRTKGFVYAAVTDPAHLRLEVVFDGVTQAIAAGADAPHADPAAQPLYDATQASPADYTDCVAAVTPASFTRRGGSAFCRARTASWPWVAGSGWSDGRPWQLVQLETTMHPADGGVVRDTKVAATLDGQAPAATSGGDQSGESTSSILVFPSGTHFAVRRTSTAPSGPLTLRGSLDLTVPGR